MMPVLAIDWADADGWTIAAVTVLRLCPLRWNAHALASAPGQPIRGGAETTKPPPARYAGAAGHLSVALPFAGITQIRS
jgi:hypothetical protein